VILLWLLHATVDCILSPLLQHGYPGFLAVPFIPSADYDVTMVSTLMLIGITEMSIGKHWLQLLKSFSFQKDWS